MGWVEAVGEAVQYVEDHITEELSAEEIAKQVNISPFYFQKGFAMLCGFTLGEYIRNRRLALAGSELASGNGKVIDIALKYGYDSPDSFAKAFTRFHGVTPLRARKEQVTLKSFAPLKIKLSLEGGYLMDYRMEKKEAFTVIANAKVFAYEGAKNTVPQFWQEHFKEGKGKNVMGVYGINIDEKMKQNSFEYLIADPYDPAGEVPEGFVVKTIPSFTWAVFPCRGAMPEALQDVNTKIFSEWLPALKEYEFAAGYCVEYYDNAAKYAKGIMDEDYYCEIWIPVKQK
ncbi:AraC family transcriptional regulator [Lacrimispora sp. 210928-DFI.3.58]|uniref:AraC family transcriptional regulator n=1 Tax=Lacrimispora sp. 210928-DFI.3.58 TaxID=2883214 RepID=UPI0015B43E0A|nr:AraC family transcriptional regulator [Lacrimispora sp. 210928-DFI.3.58]MCB7321245.1 AraC family transcriptional regulator [Lacrimispora sp. 210928-DFI.3.58]